MASKLKLMNENGKVLSIESGSIESDKVLEPGDFKYIRDTISSLGSISNPLDGDVCFIKGYHTNDDNAGGTFIYRANITKSEHNGGTIIDPDKEFPNDWNDTTQQTDWFTADNEGNGVWELTNYVEIYPENFGAKGDGIVDDTLSIINCIKVLNTGDILHLRKSYVINSKISVDKRISIQGLNTNTNNGGDLTKSTIIWNGDEESVFTFTASHITISGIYFLNNGNADYAIITFGTKYEFSNLTFNNASNVFNKGIIKPTSGSVEYSIFSNINFYGAAPIFLDLSSITTAYATNYVFKDRCIFESDTITAVKVINIDNYVVDQVVFENCTINQHGLEAALINCQSTCTVRNLCILNCEFDCDSSISTDRFGYLNNCLNVTMINNNLVGGGGRTAAFYLNNSNVVAFKSNYFKSVNGPFFEVTEFTSAYNTLYTNSVINSSNSSNSYDVSNTQGISLYGNMLMPNIVADGDYVKVIIANPSVNSVFIDNNATIGSTGIECAIDYRYYNDGYIISLIHSNTSGGTVTRLLTSTSFKLVSNTVAPDNGNRCIYTFIKQGKYFYEISRSENVPN